MATLNHSGEEIKIKVVYYGPGLSGKSTNIDYLHSQAPAHAKGKVVTTTTRTDRTLFYDFVPQDTREVNGYRTRFFLYTVPGQVYYNASRKLVLEGVDAVIFVADSSPEKQQENVDILRNLEENLNEYGLSLDHLPWVIQYNKRDVPNATPVEDLHRYLNLLNVPAFEAVAREGKGVNETFNSLASMLISRLQKKFEDRGIKRTKETVPGTTGGVREEAHRPSFDGSKPQTGLGAGEVDGDPVDGDEVSDAVDAAFREIRVDVKKVRPGGSPVPDQAGQQAGQRAGLEPRKPTTQKQTQDLWAQSVGSAPANPPKEESQAQPPASAPGLSKAKANAERPPRVSADPASGPQRGSVPHAAESVNDQADGSTRAPLQPPLDASERETEDVDTFSFEPAGEGVTSDVGRLVELEDSTDDSGPVDGEESPEFITDPMKPSLKAADEEEQQLSVTTSVIERTGDSRDDFQVKVPVVISRSQVRKTVPLKLILEIQVLDD